MVLGLAAGPVSADNLRIGFWNADLTRRGPGLLLRDVLADDPQVQAVTAVVSEIGADILVLASVDWDHDLVALRALERAFAAAGAPYPHLFAPRPNRGMATGLDLDGDGRTGGPGDAQGWGRFAGAEGMALLSRLPIEKGAAADLSGLLWRDLPGALLGPGVLPPGGDAVQRLSTTGHWIVPVRLSSGNALTLMFWHATPPVFDGPEDRNGRRNHDEAALWLALLEGRLTGVPPPDPPFVLMGDANLDPLDGQGRGDALAALLAHPALQDVRPSSDGAVAAAFAQGGVNRGHRGPPDQDTADWDDGPGDPGNLRVDYILPSAGLRVIGAGVHWPAPGTPSGDIAARAARHRLVWVDLALP